MTTTKRRRRPDIRERILEAAFDVLAETGLDGFTMTEVERRVGLAVGTGSIYRHFPSKEALLKAALEREVGRHRTAGQEARAVIEQVRDPRERKVGLYRRVLDDLGRFDKVFGLMLSQGDRVPELREAIQAAVRPEEAPDPAGEKVLHVIAMAALGGYHLFSVMQGQDFHGVQEEDFLGMLADLAPPSRR